MRLYLDSVPVIYLVEQVTPFEAAVRAHVTAAGLVLVAGELTRMECLVMPLRNNNQTLIAEFEDFFTNQVSELVFPSRAVFDRAAGIRAQYQGIKTPDALHLAAAVESGCDVFLTNDQRLKNFAGITVEII
jgi:predicted nucleic acid-binding protein